MLANLPSCLYVGKHQVRALTAKDGLTGRVSEGGMARMSCLDTKPRPGIRCSVFESLSRNSDYKKARSRFRHLLSIMTRDQKGASACRIPLLFFTDGHVAQPAPCAPLNLNFILGTRRSRRNW